VVRLTWRWRAFLLCGAASLGVSGGLARADAKTDFEIPAQPLSRALVEFGTQSGYEIVADASLTAAKSSRGAHGAVDPDLALQQILGGTGLTYRRTDDQYLILAAGAAPRRVPAAPAASATSVETVVVTAQHKSENIQQVPIAITALSQQQLTDRQIAGGPDLLKSVPNMDFTKTNFSGYNIELRGIGTQAISVTTDPAVAVAFNDTPFIRNHFFEQEFFDLDDVEVLLGPQGTLYGRNATAGVVNLKSALPTDTYEAMLSADLGNYNNRRLEAMLNIPIVGDKLDIRIAGEWTKRDGYTEDTTLNIPVDGRDLWSGRVTIGWNPTSNFKSDFVWERFSEDDDRLRSGKQLCETAQPPSTISGQVGNYTFNEPVPPPNVGGVGGQFAVFVLGRQFLSQSCQATSLYAPSAFQVPYGPSLPYVIASASVAKLVTPGVDPYAETTQSTNLRDIQSAVLPSYRARNDTLEYNATYTINSALTLTSETGFNEDFLWSSEDYNRFDSAPGFFNGPTISANSFLTTPSPAGYFKPDPNMAGAYIYCDPQLGCSDRVVAQDLDEEHAWQASQEFRLASNFGGPFNFSLGANYLHYETVEDYYVFINALSAYSDVVGTELGGPGGGVGNPAFPGSPSCLLTAINAQRLGGYQSPNPRAGGGTPLYDCVYVDPNPMGSLNNEGHNYFLSQNPYTLNSYALFGETYYNITPSLKLTTGLRWTVDQKHFIDIPSEVVDEGYGYSVSNIENQTWERPTGRAVLDWTPSLDFTDQTLLYASYAHGYKAGGANPPGAIFLTGYSGTFVPFVDHPLTFKPEYIEAFELGTKNTLLDNSLTLNGDIFYYNYTGYQISEIVDRTAINNNYNAHVEGAEVTANWEPIPGLKLNFAGGWEDTAAAGGDSGIDLMDRTAGMPGWMVVKPFPTQASNCILPDYVVAALLNEQNYLSTTSEGYGPAPYACSLAYTDHLDPVTGSPYGQNTTGMSTNLYNLFPFGGGSTSAPIPPGYPGFNPLTPAYNNGEGFAKNLAGHALPNAPPFTVSLGGEYSMPVSQDWLATLRADFYWQADSWARIFNDNPYDRIHGYDTLNLSLILNSANGWTVMGYVKNVFNVTAITGDFLNSDDTGLTTNVFLTDPRLFGVRVTKHLDESEGFWGSDWSGAEWIKDIFADSDNGKPPLWIELGGQLEHISGQGASFVPAFFSNFMNPTPATRSCSTAYYGVNLCTVSVPGPSILQEKTTPLEAQQPPLFSAGEEVKISFQPEDSDWVLSASVRYGRSGNKLDVHHQTTKIHYQEYNNNIPHRSAGADLFSQEKFVDSQVYHAESHSVMDFQAGKDVGLGLFGENLSTTLSAGIRIAQFMSHSSVDTRARPDLSFLTYTYTNRPHRSNLGPAFHTYHAYEKAARKFQGIGPSISWTGSAPVMPVDAGGLDFDWGANAAILFGRQKSTVAHYQTGRYWPKYGLGEYNHVKFLHSPPGGHTTNRDVIVPNVGGMAGISYRYQNAKISLGYRADLFIGAIDGGVDKPKSETLNMSGPFATISFGIGG
jgi:iron complex outermembrane receptor protein